MIAVEISTAERDVLFDYVLRRLGDAGDIGMAARAEDFPTAERLGDELVDLLQLIRQLGWQRKADAPIVLRMPGEQFRRVAARFHSDAEGLRREEEREEAERQEEARRMREWTQQFVAASDRLLRAVA